MQSTVLGAFVARDAQTDLVTSALPDAPVRQPRRRPLPRLRLPGRP
jgi:hypothetical protein